MSSYRSRNDSSSLLGMVFVIVIGLLIWGVIRLIIRGIAMLISSILEYRANNIDNSLQKGFIPFEKLPGPLRNLVYKTLPVENTWLKRYTSEQLSSKISNIVYNHLAITAEGYELLSEKMNLNYKNFTKNLCNEILFVRLNKHKEFGKIAKKNIDEKMKLINRYIFVDDMPEINSMRFEQIKKRFNQTMFEFPLNNQLGILYNNFNLVVITKDCKLCLTSQQLEQYEDLSQKERISFIKQNLNIEAIYLYHPDFHFRILISGDETKDAKFLMDNKYMFESFSFNERNFLISEERYDFKYANFVKLRLKDLDNVKNNDIRQFFQSKIDFSNESMAELVKKTVRGDLYKLYYYNESDFYIRYVCPSTGRVYYNEIFEDALARSEYFKKNDFYSYIDAWWSINNMFADPNNKENIIRC